MRQIAQSGNSAFAGGAAGGDREDEKTFFTRAQFSF